MLYNKHNFEFFKELVSQIHIRRYTQEEYTEIVEEIYKNIVNNEQVTDNRREN